MTKKTIVLAEKTDKSASCNMYFHVRGMPRNESFCVKIKNKIRNAQRRAPHAARAGGARAWKKKNRQTGSSILDFPLFAALLSRLRRPLVYS